MLTAVSSKPNGIVSHFATSANSPEVNPIPISTKVLETPEPPRKSSKASNNSPLDEVSSAATLQTLPPVIVKATTPVPICPETSMSNPATTFTKTLEDSQPLRDTSQTSNLTLDGVSSLITPPKLSPRVMKGATHSISLSDLFVKATSSASGFLHIDTQATVESSEGGNKTLNGIAAPQKPVRRLSLSWLAKSDELLDMDKAT